MNNIMTLEVAKTALSNYDGNTVTKYAIQIFEIIEKVINGQSQREEIFLPTSANCVCAILTSLDFEVERDIETGTYFTSPRRSKNITINFSEGTKGTTISIFTDAWLDLREIRLACFAFKAKYHIAPK